MIGHGQIEGYREKYGMEYRRPYWHEAPDEDLVHRHEREIFPLLRRRDLFAEVRNFLLYDLYTAEGTVNEDVFAYSNRAGDGGAPGEAALVVYNNRFAEARGWIRTAAAYALKAESAESAADEGSPAAGAGERRLVQKTLGEALGLHPIAGRYCIFRDHVSGLEYLVSSRDLYEQGLYLKLGAFKYRVYLDFREVDDPDGHYGRLAAELGDRGLLNIEEALQARLVPVEGQAAQSAGAPNTADEQMHAGEDELKDREVPDA
jgi:hypothetical protein